MTSPNPSGVTVNPPGWNDPHAWSPPPALQLVAATSLAGYTLVNGTGTILSWNVPNDGNLHTFVITGAVLVSSAETGGAISFTRTVPGGSPATGTAQAGGAAGGTAGFNAIVGVAGPGTTVTLTQSSALTIGAAVAFAQIWAA